MIMVWVKVHNFRNPDIYKFNKSVKMTLIRSYEISLAQYMLKSLMCCRHLAILKINVEKHIKIQNNV